MIAYTASALFAAALLIAPLGLVFLIGEGALRARAFHRRGLARLHRTETR